MMVGRQELLRAAGLARLRLGPGETDDLLDQVREILARLDRLPEIESPDAGASGLAASAVAADRSDEQGADRLEHSPADFAPAFSDGYFTVPRVLAP